MLIVFSEASNDKFSRNNQELASITETARMFGCRVYSIPANFDECETAENALAYVHEFDNPTLCVWVGFIPSFERYDAIYHAALKKNIYLINTPEQHRLAMEFDHFYPLVEDLTAKSIIIEEIDQINLLVNNLKFPLFVKGVIKSNKEQGWNAVVANNLSELQKLAKTILESDYRSRGKVIIRELLNLKKIAIDTKKFPISKEYRAFVYKGKILAYGFYWEEYGDLASLKQAEKQTLTSLIEEVARRVKVPFLAVDFGQLENGEWRLIEIGDAQFSGLSQIPVLELWSKVKNFSI